MATAMVLRTSTRKIQSAVFVAIVTVLSLAAPRNIQAQTQTTLTSFTITPSSIVGGSTDAAGGVITIQRAAGDNSEVFFLIDQNPSSLISFQNGPVVGFAPATTTNPFGIQGVIVLHDTTVTLVASCTEDNACNGSPSTATAAITLTPFVVALQAPATLATGQSGTATVTLSATNRVPIQIFLSADKAGLTFDNMITIPAFAGTLDFPVSNPAVSTPTVVTLSASLGGGIPGTATINLGPAGPPPKPVTPDLGKCPCLRDVGAPINVTNGNTYVEKTDFSVPTHAGMPLEITRTWNSLWLSSSPFATDGLFGNSWMSNYDQRLQFVSSTSLQYFGPEGKAWSFSRDTVSQPWTLINPADAHASLTFDTTSQRYMLLFKDGSQSQFNADGLLVDVADALQYFEELTYDAADTSKLLSAAGILNFSYEDPNNPHHVTTVTNTKNGLAYHYSYDASGHLLKVTYPDGTINTYQYDANSMLLSVKDNEGKVLESHTYDSQNRGLSSVRAGGVDQVSVTYPQDGAAQITNSAAASTNFGYTAAGGHGLVTSVSGAGCSTCGGQGTKTFTYDNAGNMSSSTNDLGVTITYTYDPNANVTSKSVPLPSGGTQTYSYTYNNFGEVLTSTDPLGTVTTNTYDAFANLLTSTVAASGQPTLTTTFTVDPITHLTTAVTDPLGHVTSFHYIISGDPNSGPFTTQGLVDSVTDAQGNVTHFEYDASNNRTAVVDALGNRTTYAYDSMARLTKVTNPDLSATTFAYDSRGRRTSVTDANGKVTTYAYDDADRLVSVTDAASNPTTYAYDTESNLLSITDAIGRVTSYAYDDQRRVISTTFPSGHAEGYGYDGVGNLLFKTDRNMNTTSFTYDNLNRLVTKQYPDATQVNYTYDIANRLTQVTDATGTYGFTYDNLNRLTDTSTAYSFLAGTNFNVGYAYDAASNRTALTYPGSAGSVSYAYDSLNRLTTLNDSVTGSFGFAYDALGRRTSFTRPNSVNTSYSFDAVSNLTSLQHALGGTALDGNSYTYDPAGNRTSKTNGLTGVTSSFIYDPIYQLTQVTQPGVNAQGQPVTKSVEKYLYDAVGNRLGAASPTQTYNSSNELLSKGNATYTYDNNGNMLTKVITTTSSTGGTVTSTTTYAWDFENRLASVTNPGGGVITYKYDPFGRRIQKGTRGYLYDGAGIIQELSSNGLPVVRYVQGAGIDEPLVVQNNQGTFFYHADGLGSITSLTDPTRAVVETDEYDSFGRELSHTGPVIHPYRYTAREWEADTNLYYYRARYYDQSTGRFLSEDPIGFDGGLNLYAYVHNASATATDPLGLQPSGTATGATAEEIARYIARLETQLLSKSQSAVAGAGRGILGGALATFGVVIALEGHTAGICEDSIYPPPGCPNYRPTPQALVPPAGVRSMIGSSCTDGRCDKIRQDCFDKCWEEIQFLRVPSSDKPQLLRKCIRKCMADEGCYNF